MNAALFATPQAFLREFQMPSARRLSRPRAPQILSALTVALAALSSDAFALEAPVAADAQVSTVQPSVAYGALPNLSIGGGSTALVRFDLSTLPADVTSARLAKATLLVWVNRVGRPGSLEIVAATSPWSESTVTGDGAPGTGAAGSGVQAPVAAAGQFVAVDVTRQVKAWIDAPTTNYGLALRPSADAADTSVFVDSKENTTTGHQPRLDLSFAGVGTAGARGPTGTTGAAGPRGVQGAAGAPGVVGPAGPVGATGPAGGVGTTGDRGPVGPIGATGPTGPDGPGGPRGATGAVGQAGTPGPTGPTGARGPAGPTGAQGASGVAGVDGVTRLNVAKFESSIPTVDFGPSVYLQTIYSTACPANSYVVSGGCGHRDNNTAAGDIEVYQSGPLASDPLHSWSCTLSNSSHSSGRAIVVWRTCATAGQIQSN